MKKLILSAIASLAIMVSFSSCFDVVQVNDYKNGEYYLSVKASTTYEKFNDAVKFWDEDDESTPSPEDCKSFVKAFFGDEEDVFANKTEFGKDFSMKLLSPEDEKMKEYIPDFNLFYTTIPLYVQYRGSDDVIDDGWKMSKDWYEFKLELNKIYDKYTYTVKKYTYTVKVSENLPSIGRFKVTGAKLTNCGVEVPFKKSGKYYCFEIPASKVMGNESLTIW